MVLFAKILPKNKTVGPTHRPAECCVNGVDRAVSAGEALVVGAEEGEEYEEWELDTATGAMTRQ